ncbi:hypothetical protein AMTR_s00017p00216260 [Amborella trichopoda]|uniref:Uncharacterized protein n=1 Tax=Amborella trichopoda TaxID=13333 RepID=W1PLY4_AMBTC|nr:hypothetical protein AMTR_s00017p00216260 [Amborella trichopoda]
MRAKISSEEWYELLQRFAQRFRGYRRLRGGLGSEDRRGGERLGPALEEERLPSYIRLEGS